MANTERQAQARNLLLSEYQSVLSTLSVDVPGFPFGSVVPYCLDRRGLPLILISDIAQHTRNIIADDRVSLIIAERHMIDQQAAARLTVLGRAKPVSDELLDCAWRYYSFFPQARDYHKTHGFAFYVIHPERFRFIGGFGDIGWIEKDSLPLPNPFALEEEQRIVEHMNVDHADSLITYCRTQRVSVVESDTVVMAGIDAEGMHIAVNDCIYRIPFPATIQTSMQARKILVEMSRAAT